MLTFRQVLVLAVGAALPLTQAGSGQAQVKAGVVSARSPDGKVVAAAAGNTIRLFDAQTGKEVRRLAGHQGQVTAVAFAPDGLVLASGSADRTVRLWDVRTGRIRAQMRGHTAGISAVSFSGDGKSLTTRGTDQQTLTWEVATGKLIKKQ